MIRLTFRLALIWGILSLAVACDSASKQAPGKLESGSPALEQLYQEGRADYQNGKYDEAAKKFARILEVEPTHLKALINWGATLSRNGKPTEAIVKYQEALTRDPNNAEAYYNWGVALQRLRRHPEAREKYAQAVALKRDLLTPELQRYFDRSGPGTPEQTIRGTLSPPSPQ